MSASSLGFNRAITVQADTARLADVRKFVEEVAAEVALDVERVFDLKVAVSEACANAVEHAGCGSAPLEISAQVQDCRLTITITDFGFFHPPSHPVHVVSNRGLGLPLMVALMDEVSFVRSPEGGTRVSLSLLLDGGVGLTVQ